MSNQIPVLLCGSNFGRFHARAIADHPRLRLSHILGRGSDQSRQLAERFGAKLVQDIAQVPEGIGLACVAVGSSIQSGPGGELALTLLERGIPVLQEHPIHPDELIALMRAARRHRTLHRVNLHYRHVHPVTEFIAAAKRVRQHQPVRYADVACPVHLLLPVVDVLSAAIGALRPHRLGAAARPEFPETTAPLTSLELMLGGVAVSLRVQNQLAPADRDNHALLWPRMSLGFEAGTLTLADLNGPVHWSPRLHLPGSGALRFAGGSGTDLRAPTTATLPGTAPGPFTEVFERHWPAAITRSLDLLLADLDAGRDALRCGAADLAVTRLWSEITAVLGPPETIIPEEPTLLPLRTVLGEEPTDSGWEGYETEAEFFDLAARDHVAVNSAPTALTVLEQMPPGKDPILELGAGTGLLTAAVAKATGARVWAYEPAPAMRAALFSRVVEDDELRERVTVWPHDALNGPLPPRARAVLLCGVLGHLDPDEQDQLWARLRPVLVPDAPVLVELMSLVSPASVPTTTLADVELGQQRYRWSWAAEPAGEDSVIMTSTWAAEPVIGQRRTRTTQHRWRTQSLADIAAVSRRHGIDLVADLSTTSTPLGLFQATKGSNV